MKPLNRAHTSHHFQLLAIAAPMILSNISVPLLGLVDTAVIGHLSDAYYLAGIALGSGSIALLFWLASFLRMSTTGEIAQAYGQQDSGRALQSLSASMSFALAFSLLLIVCTPWLLELIAVLSGATSQVLNQAEVYFSIRIYSAPAAMLNLVMLGFMLGMQYGRGPFYVVLFTNIVNIVLDVLFVVVLGFAVAGAAWASVIADYSALVLSCCLLRKVLNDAGWQWQIKVPHRQEVQRLLHLNRDIFIRSLMLQLCFSFMTFYGARLGEDILAANAVLLNFLMLVSFAMDGIAYAVEAKVGQAKGARDLSMLRRWVRISCLWASCFALLYTGMFALFGPYVIGLLTDIPAVIDTAQIYLPWLIVLPLIATSCFLFDGVFVGLTRAKEMRNSMLLSAVLGFFVPFWLVQHWGNHGLWFAMSCFMAVRGLTLILKYRLLSVRQQLLE
ncbi:MATE family efflux transporter DinF [Pseudoalteromonas rubra]|uniref:MATE family efflux transporter DinF n=1 Tax=Pseudoalteromonas rubra TaxID=43658 RepID=A0A5S3X5I8_9GAMM|nr:MATE family efflux transporter DinF [Pseudoalteromonas rubra]TMP39958.1 MATE family efflux transporter DinF [Pseudoalteromonas rubra]